MNLKKIIVLFITMFIFSISIHAEETIVVNKNVLGADEINVTFNYEIVSTEDDTPSLDNSNFSISFDENSVINNRIASNSYIVDFSDVNYTKPGRYEYIMREISSTDESVYPVDTNYFKVYVNVLNELDNDNKPTGNYIIDVLQSGFLNETSGKGDIIFETKPLTYFTLSKNVTGDIADINEYFKFKIDISDGDGFIINGQDSSVIYNGETITTSNTYDSTKDNYVYLKHGQSVTIGLDGEDMQIEANSGLTIVEMDSTNYKTYINNSNTNNKSYAAFILNTPSSNTVSYVNNNESTVLTGLFVNVLPFAILIALSIISIYVLKKKTKRVNE